MNRLFSSVRNKAYKTILELILKLLGRNVIKQNIYFNHHPECLLLQLNTKQEALTITPLIQVLRNNYECNLTVISTNECYDIFSNNPYVNNVIIISEKIKSIIKMIFQYRSRKYDLIIDTHEKQNYKASIISGFLRSSYKIGFAKDGDNVLTHVVPKKNISTTHIVDRILSLAEVFDLTFSKAKLNILYRPSEKAIKVIDDYFINHDLKHNMTALINISSNTDLGFWGIESYKSLLKYLKNYDINIIIGSSIEDIETAERIAGDDYLIFYNTDFDIYSELIHQVDFVFSPDSFTVQLAAAFRVPIFCLFVQYQTNSMINVPYNSDFDFVLTEDSSLSKISFGKVLNGFVPYFEYIYKRYKNDPS